MSVIDTIKSLLGMGDGREAEPGAGDAGESAGETAEEESAGASTPLDGDVQQQGDLELSSSAFDDGEQMPDWVGYANDNDNPPLSVDGVPEDAASLVLVLDDPDAEPVVGHVYDHWLVWDLDPDADRIPRDWDAADATVGYNDYGENDYGGPAPPQGSHTYRFKLLALADELDAPPQTRKSRLGSMVVNRTEILAATQLEGTYDADQGTIF